MIFVFGLVIIGLIAAVFLIMKFDKRIKIKIEDIDMDVLYLIN